jgi:hypothetical protein
VGARAAEDHVRAVRPHRGRRQGEEVRAAAQDVVLAETAEDRVVAAVALDVVVAVGGGLERRSQDEVVVDIARGARAAGDRAVALDRVVAELAEDLVVAPTAGDRVVAEVGSVRCARAA